VRMSISVNREGDKQGGGERLLEKKYSSTTELDSAPEGDAWGKEGHPLSDNHTSSAILSARASSGLFHLW